MDKIEKIRQDIERHRQAIRVLNEHTAPEQMSKTCAIFQYSDSILSDLLSFIDTLSEEPDKSIGWVSVKDRLPKKDGWYFTCVEMSGVPQCVGLSHFETYSGQWDDDDDSIELVDYWMDIPALPEEERI